MADRVGVINHGEIILVERKAELMRKLGKKRLTLQLTQPAGVLPDTLGHYGLVLSDDGRTLTYTYDKADQGGIDAMLNDLGRTGLRFTDLATHQSSLEDIFVGLLEGPR
jgi:ABC-2 type transport system ATP-binding protein